MPTRIVWRETEGPSQLSPARRQNNNYPSDHGFLQRFPQSYETPERLRTPPISPRMSPKASSHRIVGFRSTIIREIPQVVQESRKSGLSTTDIRASPRLLGYLFQLLASTVMLITVIQFYREQNNESFLSLWDLEENGGVRDKRIFNSVKGPVYYWKLIGCVIVGSAGAAMSLSVLLVHFDTVCLPRLWFMIFRDGSRLEQAILWSMLLFWATGLYVCTSSLSVGEAQANVYFTAWIAFLSAALNCGVWRASAGLPSIAEKISLHHRETTYNWTWTLFFVCIFSVSATDIFFNRDEITLRLKGKVLNLSERDWITTLAIIWGFVGLCVVALTLNHYLTNSWEVKLCAGKRRFVLGWRQVEGIVVLGMVGVFFWIIYEHTGVNGLINGLNNGYFGIWGSFFNSVFTFGTWLRENKDIEYIVRDDEEER